jgi:hypothetical protein
LSKTAEAEDDAAEPFGAVPGSSHTEVIERVRRTDRRLPYGRIPPKWDVGARHAAGVRRHLPWSLVPFDEISSGGRNVGLPRRHHPPSEFLTLSTVYSHLDLVALFRATSAHGISAFRAFPSQPAVSPLGDPLLSCRQISNNSCELPPRLSSASVDSKRHRGKSSEIARAAPGEY